MLSDAYACDVQTISYVLTKDSFASLNLIYRLTPINLDLRDLYHFLIQAILKVACHYISSDGANVYLYH